MIATIGAAVADIVGVSGAATAALAGAAGSKASARVGHDAGGAGGGGLPAAVTGAAGGVAAIARGMASTPGAAATSGRVLAALGVGHSPPALARVAARLAAGALGHEDSDVVLVSSGLSSCESVTHGHSSRESVRAGACGAADVAIGAVCVDSGSGSPGTAAACGSAPGPGNLGGNAAGGLLPPRMAACTCTGAGSARGAPGAGSTSWHCLAATAPGTWMWGLQTPSRSARCPAPRGTLVRFWSSPSAKSNPRTAAGPTEPWT